MEEAPSSALRDGEPDFPHPTLSRKRERGKRSYCCPGGVSFNAIALIPFSRERTLRAFEIARARIRPEPHAMPRLAVDRDRLHLRQEAEQRELRLDLVGAFRVRIRAGLQDVAAADAVAGATPGAGASAPASRSAALLSPAARRAPSRKARRRESRPRSLRAPCRSRSSSSAAPSACSHRRRRARSPAARSRPDSAAAGSSCAGAAPSP